MNAFVRLQINCVPLQKVLRQNMKKSTQITIKKVLSRAIVFIFVFAILCQILALLIFIATRVTNYPPLVIASSIQPSDISGIWIIQDPRLYLGANYDKRGWEKSLLELRDDGLFVLKNMTTEFKNWGFEPPIEDSVELISGTWTVEHIQRPSLENEEHYFFRLELSPKNDVRNVGVLVLMADKSGEIKLNWKLPLQQETLEEKGIIWKKITIPAGGAFVHSISSASKPQVSDAIFGENPESGQVDTSSAPNTL